MVTLRRLSRTELESLIAQIEAEVPGMKAAYESEENHGDSCWHSLVGWDARAGTYSDYRWLLEAN